MDLDHERFVDTITSFQAFDLPDSTTLLLIDESKMCFFSPLNITQNNFYLLQKSSSFFRSLLFCLCHDMTHRRTPPFIVLITNSWAEIYANVDCRERAINLRPFGIHDLHTCLPSDFSFPNSFMCSWFLVEWASMCRTLQIYERFMKEIRWFYARTHFIPTGVTFLHPYSSCTHSLLPMVQTTPANS